MSSFGEELRRERELRQITLREISEATKINLRYLDALERNDFRPLPGGVFNKGFVRAYAEYIGVDPETMVNAYLLEERGQRADSGDGFGGDLFRPSGGSAIRTESMPDPAPAETGPGAPVRWGMWTAAVVLVAAATALGWWWWSGGGAPPIDGAEAPVERPAVEPTTVAPAETGEVASGDDGPGETPVSVAAPPPPERETTVTESPAAEPPPQKPAGPGPSVPRVRIVLQRPTQGRLNCDNRRVEILDGLSGGTEMVFQCREFLLVDALDGGAVLVESAGSAVTALGPDGVPVVGHYVVPAKQRSKPEEPS